MTSKLLISCVLSAGLCSSVGCGKAEDKGGEAPAAATAASGDKAPVDQAADPKPARPKVFEYATAQELDEDFRSVTGAAFMDKFGLDGKMQVTGKVKRTISEMDESLKLWLDVAEKKWISIAFADKGAKAKEAKIAKDSEVTVLCSIGGSTDTYIMLTDCELK